MQQLQFRYETQIRALENRVMELENSANSPPQSSIVSARVKDDAGRADQLESRFSWSLAGLGTAGGSSATADELELLQQGSHDPRRNGFTVQAVAVAARAELGQHLDATATIVSYIEPSGENVVELGPAFIHATDLPGGLSFKAGQFFQDFGKENKRHAAEWDFVDVPFLITRYLGGDKLRTQGVQFALAMTLPWSSSVYMGAFNPKYDTAISFLDEAGKTVGGHPLQDRNVDGVDDLLYLLKWSHDLPMGATEGIDLGVSALFGPNASGDTTSTQIYNLNLRWSHYGSTQGQRPIFDWRTELMYRHYEAGDRSDPSHEVLIDYGAFSQLLWRFTDNWTAGFRAEFANSDDNSNADNDPLRGKRTRFAVNLTRPLSPRAWWRLQYNHDQAEFLMDKSADSIWLQLGYKVGAHDED